MKELFSVFLFLFCMMSVKAEDTMTFVAGSDVCTPITVTVGGTTNRVTTLITIPAKSGTVTAKDCDGYKLKYDYSHRSNNGQSIDTYTFHEAYDPNRGGPSSSSGSSGGYYGGNNNSSDGWGEMGARIGSGLADLTSTRSFTEGGAYPGLHADFGMSKGYGEFCRSG